MSWNERKYVKSISNIIDCDLKKDWQILIIFGANIFDTTCHQMTVFFKFPPLQMFAFALPGKTRTGEIR